MAITLITGPANSGKARLVMSAVQELLARGEEPLLIVPNALDADHYRRELAGAGALMGMRVERFGGLLAEVVRRAGPAPPSLGELARERILQELLRHAGIDAPPGFARELGAFFGELRVAGIDPGRLAGALARWARADGPESPRDELAGLFGAYERELQRIGRSDEQQRAVAALDALRRRPALWRDTPVLFYGFDDLTRLQLDAIETLGSVVGAPVTVSLAYQPGRTAFAGRAGAVQELLPLAARHTELPSREDYYAPAARAALGHLERSLFEPGAPRARPARALQLLEGADERHELELIAAEIGDLLDAGMRAEEIAVVHRAPAGVGDLLAEVFAGAPIPYAYRRRRRFADTAVGRGLIGLLRCVPDRDGAVTGELADLLAWLRAPGVLERPPLADRLEAHARRVGAHGAAQARALWEESNWPLERIDRLRTAGATLIDGAARELERLFSAPRRRRAAVLAAGELDEAGALAQGRRALRELRELARLDARLAPADAPALAALLEDVRFGAGELPAPGRVTVADPLTLRARRVRALFLCGLQEGVFPAPAGARPVLAEEQRRRLALVSGLTALRDGASADPLAAERYLLYAVASRPEELLVLSWHAAGEDGAPVARSPFVDDVCDLFDESLSGPARPHSRPPRHGRAPGAVAAGDTATGRGEGGGSAGAATVAPAAAAQALGPVREAELLLGRDQEGAGAGGHLWSASSLELWIRCPIRWFVERVLRAEDLDPEPEPFARGGLAHAVLKDTLEGLHERSGSARLTAASLPLALELLDGALREHEPEFPLSAAPERRPAVRRRLRADLERYLAYAAAAGGAPELEPSHFELQFGFAGEGEPGPLDLGGDLRLRGRIDRVDAAPGGGAVVYDYKGSRVLGAGKWLAEGNVQLALYMQAVERLLGLRVLGGLYQPLAGSDLRPRGVLDEDAGLQLDSVGGDTLAPEEVRELLSEATELARTAAAQARRGELEPRPPTCTYRGGCAYPTICRCEP